MQTLRKPLIVLGDLYELLVLWCPGLTGQRLRERFYRRRLRAMGSNVVIEAGVRITSPEHVSIGDNCWIDRYAVLLAGPPRRGARKVARRENEQRAIAEGELVIGPNVHVAPHTVISGHGGVLIEGNTTVAAGARVYSLSHHYRDLDDPADRTRYRFSSNAAESEQALLSAPVIIEDGAAVALNAVVLPGCTIGRDTWVAAGSVVTRSLPPGIIAAGAPARQVRER